MASMKNPRHERFAQLIAAGRSQVDAYREAGFTGNPHRNASNTLTRNPAIGDRIEELLQERARTEQEAMSIAAREIAVDKAWVM